MMLLICLLKNGEITTVYSKDCVPSLPLTVLPFSFFVSKFKVIIIEIICYLVIFVNANPTHQPDPFIFQRTFVLVPESCSQCEMSHYALNGIKNKNYLKLVSVCHACLCRQSSYSMPLEGLIRRLSLVPLYVMLNRRDQNCGLFSPCFTLTFPFLWSPPTIAPVSSAPLPFPQGVLPHLSSHKPPPPSYLSLFFLFHNAALLYSTYYFVFWVQPKEPFFNLSRTKFKAYSLCEKKFCVFVF